MFPVVWIGFMIFILIDWRAKKDMAKEQTEPLENIFMLEIKVPGMIYRNNTPTKQCRKILEEAHETEPPMTAIKYVKPGSKDAENVKSEAIKECWDVIQSGINGLLTLIEPGEVEKTLIDHNEKMFKKYSKDIKRLGKKL